MTDTIFACIKRRLNGRGHRQMPDQHWKPPNHGEPTKAQPGTRAKVNVMRDRLERGEPLFNSRDRKCFDDGGPC